MAELDIETLKRRREDRQFEGRLGTWLSWDELEAIIAALEGPPAAAGSVEKLKQRYARFPNALTVTIARADFDAIIAALDDGKLHRFLLDKALEDRERLRAARASITHTFHVRHGIHVHLSVWVNHAKAGTLILREDEFKMFCAALEDHDG